MTATLSICILTFCAVLTVSASRYARSNRSECVNDVITTINNSTSVLDDVFLNHETPASYSLQHTSNLLKTSVFIVKSLWKRSASSQVWRKTLNFHSKLQQVLHQLKNRRYSIFSQFDVSGFESALFIRELEVAQSRLMEYFDDVRRGDVTIRRVNKFYAEDFDVVRSHGVYVRDDLRKCAG